MIAYAAAPRAVAPAAPPGFAAAPAGLGTEATLLLTGLHLGAAMLFLLAGAAGLVWAAPELGAGRFLEPRVAGVTHLFTLGWLTTTILGALYQLLPVALGTPIRSARAGHLALVLHAPGVFLFAGGVAASDDAIRHAGLALVIPGLLIGIGNVGASLWRAPRRDVTWWAVLLALVALGTTIVMGALLVHNLKHGVLGAARVRVLALHVHLALAGWALAPMIGMSRRLLPMFLLSHGVPDTWSRRALALLAAALPVLTIGLAAGHATTTRVGALLLAAAVAAFLSQARQYYRARVRRKLDAGLRIAATGLCMLGASVPFGAATLARGTAAPRLAAAYGILVVLGGVLLYVVGHFYKIAPFLAWLARYRHRMGREPVPTIAELYSSRVAHAQWVALTAAVVVMTAGTVAGHPRCVRMGATLFLAGVLLFASQMARVALPIVRARRPSGEA